VSTENPPRCDFAPGVRSLRLVPEPVRLVVLRDLVALLVDRHDREDLVDDVLGVRVRDADVGQQLVDMERPGVGCMGGS
jgi:hypothetical protein